MKFLTVSMYTEGHGGYYRHRRMARALIRAGHDVVWISPGVSDNIGEEFLPMYSFYSWLPGPIGWILRLRANLLFYREHLHNVDAVFTTKEYDALACILDSVTKKMKHIFFTHGDTINCEKFLTKNARSISRRIKSRIMLLYYPWLQRIILKQLSHVVVQAKFLADTLQHRHPGLDCKYIVLTSDCVFTYPAEKPNVRHLKVLDELKKKDKFIIGTIAQVFYKAKGFNIFLDAMSELRSLPNIHAVIAGYGDEADLIPQNIERLGLENIVTYLGKSPAANQLMPKIDVIVSPTQFFDAFPTVILEALDADCCIVASDIEAHKSQLNDDLLLFENSNHIQLAEKLKRLYDDHGFRNKNREIVQIRKKIFEFDWDAKVVDIFESRILG